VARGSVQRRFLQRLRGSALALDYNHGVAETSPFREIKLGDAIHIKHGFAFKGEYFVEEGEMIVLTPGNFYEKGGFRVRPGKDRAYSGDVPDDYILNEGDLIVAMTEQGPGLLGSSALVPESNRYPPQSEAWPHRFN
jgi:hypothetical protein